MLLSVLPHIFFLKTYSITDDDYRVFWFDLILLVFYFTIKSAILAVKRPNTIQSNLFDNDKKSWIRKAKKFFHVFQGLGDLVCMRCPEGHCNPDTGIPPHLFAPFPMIGILAHQIVRFLGKIESHFWPGKLITGKYYL